MLSLSSSHSSSRMKHNLHKDCVPAITTIPFQFAFFPFRRLDTNIAREPRALFIWKYSLDEPLRYRGAPPFALPTIRLIKNESLCNDLNSNINIFLCFRIMISFISCYVDAFAVIFAQRIHSIQICDCFCLDHSEMSKALSQLRVTTESFRW